AVACHPAARAILRMDEAALLAGTEWPLVADDGSPVALADAIADESNARVIALRHPDGTRAWISLSTRAMAGEGNVVVSFADITERRIFQQQLEHAALHDALTGLP